MSLKDFEFKTIGKLPSLFNRISSPIPSATYSDEQDQEMDVSGPSEPSNPKPINKGLLERIQQDPVEASSSGAESQPPSQTMFQIFQQQPLTKTPVHTPKLSIITPTATAAEPTTSSSQATPSTPNVQMSPHNPPTSNHATPSTTSALSAKSTPHPPSSIAPVHAPPASALRAVQQNLSAALANLQPYAIDSLFEKLEQALSAYRADHAELTTLTHSAQSDSENAIKFARKSFATSKLCDAKVKDMGAHMKVVEDVYQSLAGTLREKDEAFKTELGVVHKEAGNLDKWTSAHERAVELTKRRRREAELHQRLHQAKEGSVSKGDDKEKEQNCVQSLVQVDSGADEAEAAWSRQRTEYLERKRKAEEELRKKKEEEEEAETKMREEEERLRMEREKAEEDARIRREEYEAKKAERLRAEQEAREREEKERVELEKKQKEIEEMKARARVRAELEEQERKRKVLLRLEEEKKKREEEEKRKAQAEAQAEAEQAEKQKRLQEEQEGKRRQVLANKQRAKEEQAEKIRKQRQDTSLAKSALAVEGPATTADVPMPSTATAKKARARASPDADRHAPPSKKFKQSPPLKPKAMSTAGQTPSTTSNGAVGTSSNGLSLTAPSSTHITTTVPPVFTPTSQTFQPALSNIGTQPSSTLAPVTSNAHAPVAVSHGPNLGNTVNQPLSPLDLMNGSQRPAMDGIQMGSTNSGCETTASRSNTANAKGTNVVAANAQQSVITQDTKTWKNTPPTQKTGLPGSALTPNTMGTASSAPSQQLKVKSQSMENSSGSAGSSTTGTGKPQSSVNMARNLKKKNGRVSPTTPSPASTTLSLPSSTANGSGKPQPKWLKSTPAPPNHPLPAIPPSPFAADKPMSPGTTNSGSVGAHHAQPGVQRQPQTVDDTRTNTAPQGSMNSSLSDILNCDIQSDVMSISGGDGYSRRSASATDFDRPDYDHNRSGANSRRYPPNIDHYSPSPPLSANHASSSYALGSSYVPQNGASSSSTSSDGAQYKPAHVGSWASPLPRRGDHYSPPSRPSTVSRYRSPERRRSRSRGRSRSRSESPQLRYPDHSLPPQPRRRSSSPEPAYSYESPQKFSRSVSPIAPMGYDQPYAARLSPRSGHKRRAGYQYGDEDDSPVERGRRGRYDFLSQENSDGTLKQAQGLPPPPPRLPPPPVNGDSYRPASAQAQSQVQPWRKTKSKYPPADTRNLKRKYPTMTSRSRSPPSRPASAMAAPVPVHAASHASVARGPSPSNASASHGVPLAQRFAIPPSQSALLAPSPSPGPGSLLSGSGYDDKPRSSNSNSNSNGLDLLNRMTDPTGHEKRAPVGGSNHHRDQQHHNHNQKHSNHYHGLGHGAAKNFNKQSHQGNGGNVRRGVSPYSRRQGSGVALEQRISKPSLAERL